MSTQNPLLQPFTGRDQAVPFDLIKTEHYVPALETSIAEAKTNLEKIKSEKNLNFETVILALEKLSEKIDRVSSVYFNLFSAEADEEMQKLAQVISPMLSAFSSDISLDPEFGRDHILISQFLIQFVGYQIHRQKLSWNWRARFFHVKRDFPRRS